MYIQIYISIIIVFSFFLQRDQVPDDYDRRDPEHKHIYRFVRTLFSAAQLTAECAIVTLVLFFMLYMHVYLQCKVPECSCHEVLTLVLHQSHFNHTPDPVLLVLCVKQLLDTCLNCSF